MKIDYSLVENIYGHHEFQAKYALPGSHIDFYSYEDEGVVVRYHVGDSDKDLDLVATYDLVELTVAFGNPVSVTINNNEPLEVV